MENKWRKIQWGKLASRRIALQNYMLVAVGWGEGGGEVRACRKWKTSATGKAHAKLNKKKRQKSENIKKN